MVAGSSATASSYRVPIANAPLPARTNFCCWLSATILFRSPVKSSPAVSEYMNSAGTRKIAISVFSKSSVRNQGRGLRFYTQPSRLVGVGLTIRSELVRVFRARLGHRSGVAETVTLLDFTHLAHERMRSTLPQARLPADVFAATITETSERRFDGTLAGRQHLHDGSLNIFGKTLDPLQDVGLLDIGAGQVRVSSLGHLLVFAHLASSLLGSGRLHRRLDFLGLRLQDSEHLVADRRLPNRLALDRQGDRKSV